MRELINAVKLRKINYYGIIIVGIIYIFNKLYLRNHTSGLVKGFCRCYLNDLLCPIIFFGIVQIIMIWIGIEIKSVGSYISIAVIMSIFWEYVAPIINPKSVSDKWDICCYLLGTVAYYIFWKKEVTRKNEKIFIHTN